MGTTLKVPASGWSSPGAESLRKRGLRSDYRIIISNLPETGSWEDLKDHMREAGEICHANVFKDRTGVIEYDSMVYAAKKLDDTLLVAQEGHLVHPREGGLPEEQEPQEEAEHLDQVRTTRMKRWGSLSMAVLGSSWQQSVLTLCQ